VTGPGVWGPARSWGLHLALGQLAVAGVLVAALELAIFAPDLAGPGWVLALFPLGAGVYLGFGLVAWLRRPSNRVGALLCAGGLVWLAVGLANTDSAALVAIGQILATVPLAIVVHLLLAVPSGRLTTVRTRQLVAAGYATALVLQVPLYVFAAAPAPYGPLQLADRPGLVTAGEWIQRAAGLAVMGLTSLVLIHRLRVAGPSRRRMLSPLYAYGIVVVVSVPVVSTGLRPLLGWSGATSFAVQAVALLLVPVAFGLSIMRGGFARTAEMAELGAWLGTENLGRANLRRGLARTLGDSSLTLAFWVPDHGGYLDAEGRPVGLPAAGSGRAFVEIERAGQRIGAICYDSTLIVDPDLVVAAGRVVAIAVDRERLTAELRANQDALRQSRLRIVEAGDRERRRIERNLHDGAQQRMMSVALNLRMAEQRAADEAPDVRELVAEAAEDLDAAVRELRELAHGLHPALLTDLGLVGALESLAERSPISVRLSSGVTGELPEPVLVGAYYVVAEAITNAAKHSGAAQALVAVKLDDGILRVEIVDDGKGGASAAPGTGLEGLTDRVDSLGGRLVISSPLGEGTRLVAEFPCA
jgi:signal transduction histidine kinase